MTKTDISTEVLLVRREMAERATPGPWMPGTALDTGTVREGDGYILVDCRLTTSDGIANAAHIAANSPDVMSLREAARRALEPNCADQLAPEG